MSVNLYYDTIQPVPQPVATQIVADARALIRQHDWWCEPLRLSLNPSGQINGSTKMILGGYSLDDGGFVEVPDNEEWLMVWSDVTFIVNNLSTWSAKYHVDWKLNTEGDPVGEIHAGSPDEKLNTFIQGLRSSSTLSEDQVAFLSRRYASRNGPPPPMPRSSPSGASAPPQKKPWWKLW